MTSTWHQRDFQCYLALLDACDRRDVDGRAWRATAAELGRRLGWPKATVRQVWQRLQACGAIRRTDANRNAWHGTGWLFAGLDYPIDASIVSLDCARDDELEISVEIVLDEDEGDRHGDLPEIATAISPRSPRRSPTSESLHQSPIPFHPSIPNLRANTST